MHNGTHEPRPLAGSGPTRDPARHLWTGFRIIWLAVCRTAGQPAAAYVALAGPTASTLNGTEPYKGRARASRQVKDIVEQTTARLHRLAGPLVLRQARC